MKKYLNKKEMNELIGLVISRCCADKEMKVLYNIGKMGKKKLYETWCRYSEKEYNAVCLIPNETTAKGFVKYMKEWYLLKPEQRLLNAVFGDNKNVSKKKI